ncbi:hypothetical protein F5Y18DRAFT_388393 [Xylariaceae sp. FL1019]|nr:hypothetical protein F5Y18DRAFT_388393 [Xylariaceae sp. FL1019]
MESFPLFSKLPVELRLLIWEFALHREAEGRVVVLQDNRVLPFKSLISPLLKLNVECREFALKRFYTLKLDVYAVDSFSFIIRWFELGESTSWTRDELFHNIEEDAVPEGTIYVSPDYDKFMISGEGRFEPLPMSGLYHGNSVEEYYVAIKDEFEISHVSGHLCGAQPSFRNLVVVQLFGLQEDSESFEPGSTYYEEFMEVYKKHVYTEREVEKLWQIQTFSGIQNYWQMWVDGDEWNEESGSLLQDISQNDGMLPKWHCMDKLVRHEKQSSAADSEGIVLVNLRIRDGFRLWQSYQRERRRGKTDFEIESV